MFWVHKKLQLRLAQQREYMKRLNTMYTSQGQSVPSKNKSPTTKKTFIHVPFVWLSCIIPYWNLCTHMYQYVIFSYKATLLSCCLLFTNNDVQPDGITGEKTCTERERQSNFFQFCNYFFYWLIPDLIFQLGKWVASSSSTPSQLEMSRRWPGRCVRATTHQQQTVHLSQAVHLKPSSSCSCTNHVWWVAYCFARVHSLSKKVILLCSNPSCKW